MYLAKCAPWFFFVAAAGLHAQAAMADEMARIAVVSQEGGTVAEIDTGLSRVAVSADVGKGPAAIAAAPDGGLLYITYPDGHAIGVFDPAAGRLQRTLPFAGEPFGVAAGSDALYVADWSKDTVSRINLNSGQSTSVVVVGKSPAALVFDAASHRLYVADRESGDVTVIEADAMRKLAAVATGAAPFALALSPDGRRLYVANVRSNDLAIIDTERLERIATVAVGAMPYGVAVTPDGASILVTNQHAGTLSIIDAKSLVVTAIIPVGRYPEGVFAASGGLAYVANWFSGDVSVIDLSERREVHRIKVGDGPRNFAPLFDVKREH